MRVERKVVRVETRKRIEILDVTEFAREFVREISALKGLLHVFLPHTTAGLVINEKEEGLLRDIEDLLERLAPELGNYEHNRIDNNAHAHLRNILTSSSLTIPVENQALLMGTWQRILLIEGDGPRERMLILTYVGL